ncbi:hypothetical protein Q2463_26915, partial [Escherichia coli]|nr:hypothetical protein [Escherichia coli]
GERLAMHSGASKINNKNSFFYNHKQYDRPHGASPRHMQPEHGKYSPNAFAAAWRLSLNDPS